jgi:hypothetical protein
MMTTKRSSDFATKVKYAAIGALITAAAVTGVYFATAFFFADRPPIIVKNGSVIIENQPLKGKSTNPGWVDDGQEWKIDHEDPPNVGEYLVGVTGGVSGECEDLRGTHVRIEHDGNGASLTFRIANDEPKVGPKGQLTPETVGGLRRLRFGDQGVRATRVLVYDQNPQQGRSCQLGTDSQVWIWPE